MTVPNLKLLSTYSIMLNNKFHTQLPLKRRMNGGEGIHIDSYKESHLNSHQGDLVSNNVTKVAPLLLIHLNLGLISTCSIAIDAIIHVRESIKSIDILH